MSNAPCAAPESSEAVPETKKDRDMVELAKLFLSDGLAFCAVARELKLGFPNMLFNVIQMAIELAVKELVDNDDRALALELRREIGYESAVTQLIIDYGYNPSIAWRLVHAPSS